jgi:hypothetical protein
MINAGKQCTGVSLYTPSPPNKKADSIHYNSLTGMKAGISLRLKPQFAKLLWFTSTYVIIMFIENAIQVLKPAEYSLL